MDIVKEGNMGVPPHLDIWVDTFYNNTVSLIREFIKLGREDNPSFYLDEEKTIESYSLNFKNEKNFDSSVFLNNPLKLKNLSIELDVYSVQKQHFSTDEWNAHYSDSTSELKGDILHSSEIYFEFFIPEEIFEVDVKELEHYLYDTNIKSYIMEYLSHELTHMYEFYIRRINNTDTNWNERENNLVFNLMGDYLDTIGMKHISKSWNDLMYLIYMSTGFEINARVIQLYYRLNNMSNNVKSYGVFKENVENTLVNREIDAMSDFDPTTWYDEFEYNEDLVGGYLSAQEWITDEIIENNDTKYLVVKSLISDLDYIIERLNTMDKNIIRIPQQHIEDPILFLNRHNKRIKKYHNKLTRKITRLYNKFV
jgi:hypothetical protein